MQDKEIMWFPVLSAVTSLLALIAFGVLYFFLIMGGHWDSAVMTQESSGSETLSTGGYLILFAYYLLMTFITNFFLAGIYVIAHARFTGKDLTFNDGMNGAKAQIERIFLWSLISATVGVILQMIADRSKIIGKIVVMVLGAAWNILTYFSLPALVIGNTSIPDAFRESATVIRKNWGETIIINLGVGLFFGLLTFFFLLIGILLIIAVPHFLVVIGVIGLDIIFLTLITIISSSLSAIFKLALYEYAKTGVVPQGFSPEFIQNAIRK